MHAGAALAGAGLGLGHAMAQALGGRYGSRTVPPTRSACRPRCASTSRSPPPRSPASARRSAARRRRRQGRGAGPPGRLRAAPRPRRPGARSCRSSPRPRPSAPARRRTRARPRPGDRRAPARGLVGIRAWPRTGASRSTSTTRATARSSSSGSPRAGSSPMSSSVSAGGSREPRRPARLPLRRHGGARRDADGIVRALLSSEGRRDDRARALAPGRAGLEGRRRAAPETEKSWPSAIASRRARRPSP